MNKSFALILTVLIATFFFSISGLSAETDTADINLRKIYYASPRSEAETNTLNPEIYKGSFLSYSKDEKHFLFKNIKLKLQDTRPQNLHELSTLESVAIKSEFALLENLKFSSDVMVAMPPIADLGMDHFLQRDPFNENYAAQQDHLNFVPRSFNEDSMPSLLFSLNYRPLQWAHFGLGFDRNWENRFIRSNLTNKNRGFLKMSVGSFFSTSLTTGLDVVDTTHIKNNKLHRTNCTYFTELANDRWNYRTFIRYQNENFDDHADYRRDYQADSFIVGVKKNWTRIDDAWIRLGVTHKETRDDEDKHFAAFGFKYSPHENINFNMQNSYEMIKLEKDQKENINFTGGIEIKLPFNLLFRNFAIMNKTLDGKTNYQFLGTIFRRFKS